MDVANLQLFNHFKDHPEIIKNGFRAAGLPIAVPTTTFEADSN